MRIALTAFLSLFGIAANAADLAPYSCCAEEVHAFDVVGGAEAAVGYGFAGLSAETGVGIAAGVAVGLHGTDVAIAGYNAMANGVSQDTQTSQGLQAVGVPQDWANGVDAGISVIGTMGVGAAAKSAMILPSRQVGSLRNVGSMARVRHHTSAENLRKIQTSNVINPARGDPIGVHVETQLQSLAVGSCWRWALELCS